MHRAIHHKSVYKYVHRVHHVSTNPTPWASFSFHPLEAVLEVGILPIMVFLMPLHPAAIVTWLLFMTLMNVMGHLGFELFWKGFTTGKITKWANTSVHHNMHHKYVNSNFGLYFNLWDRIMGTNHKNYTEEFEAIKSKEESEVNLLLD
jgi:sterol desaturase/sphingolipid hydroxylase (fatty acid hydroxylase superfamily)